MMSAIECLPDGHSCQADGEQGNCCSEYCQLNLGEEHGYCVANSQITSFPIRVTTATCLGEGERCTSDGSLGLCCSLNCFQLLGQKYGECLGSSPPTPESEKCLEDGEDCSLVYLSRYGFCCSDYCDVKAPHTIGKCKPNPNEIRNVENLFWNSYSYVGLPLIAALILLGFIWLHYRQRKIEKAFPRNEIQKFFYGNSKQACLNGYAHENIDSLPYNKNFEIPKSEFNYDDKFELGSGCCGQVFRGTVRSMEAAVKIVRANNNDSNHLRSLLSEIKILQYIGSFDHLVSLIGCNTSDLKYGKVFLFLEYCPLGSLENYLRRNKQFFKNLHGQYRQSENYVSIENILDDDEEDTNATVINSNNLLEWCVQITNAMKYLECKKVIHADIAARNVLLLRKNCAKLTDFGLSRRLYEYDNYVKRHEEPLPWRYMALESLQQLSFSHQSDVWSLGITFWEIYTLGDVPYPGLSWTSDFIAHLKDGLRPIKPNYATEEIYAIMMDCWKPCPDTRPKFADIYKRLHECNRVLSLQQTNSSIPNDS